MKLYICWSTNGGEHHDCHKVHRAVTDAGHQPEIVKARGQEHLPKLLQGKARREVFAMTGAEARAAGDAEDARLGEGVAAGRLHPGCPTVPVPRRPGRRR